MITETNEYKGLRFTCDNPDCDYVVSSDATDDFDVDDFRYCPYCGWKQGEVEHGRERSD